MRGLLLCVPFAPAHADDVSASPPRNLSATIYRAPYRNGGSLNLNALGGFALITETRVVHLPAGESRLRFEGVVGGIIPESAIVTGLPSGVIEKNRDAAVLSPSALFQRALGSDVTLERTNRKTGKTIRIAAKIRSADDQGVVFQTADGLEALRCSGTPETFSFARVPAGLSSVPTLSVLTRAAHEVTATVTLSYLAQGFDWSADYTATLNPDGKTLDLGAWITLANGNGEGLPNAQTQIVAGRLNRAWEQAFFNPAPKVVARCWPNSTTSDVHGQGSIALVHPYGFDVMNRFKDSIIVTARRVLALPMMAIAAPAPPPPPPPPPEQLGDLKLYRVPQRTTILAREQKQTRLLEQHGVPYTRVYLADLYARANRVSVPAQVILRTKNDKASQLGLPLPAGRVAVFENAARYQFFSGAADIRDTAEGEDVELKMGNAPDIQIKQIALQYNANAPDLAQLAPNLAIAFHNGKTLEQVEISNAEARDVSFELRLQTYTTMHVTQADPPMAMKDGRPIFRFVVPAHGSTIVHYIAE